jgi:hypothetical protein
MEFRNGLLLQLIECIESTQNEVKRKMIETDACTVAPKSHARLAREEKVRATSQLTPAVVPDRVVSSAGAFQKNARCDAGVIARREPSRCFPPSIMRDDFSDDSLKELV